LFPAFRQQNYAAGLRAAVDRIALIIERNEPAPANLRQPGRLDDLLGIIAMLSMFLAIGSYMFGAGLAQRSGCLIPFSALFVAIPFLIGWLVAAPWAPIVHVPIALVLGWLGWRAPKADPSRSRRHWPGGGSWTIPGSMNWPPPTSGWPGGGFSGGGGGWGGFGGGRSGGGGASGGW
jgi:uncharacterized protein